MENIFQSQLHSLYIIFIGVNLLYKNTKAIWANHLALTIRCIVVNCKDRLCCLICSAYKLNYYFNCSFKCVVKSISQSFFAVEKILWFYNFCILNTFPSCSFNTSCILRNVQRHCTVISRPHQQS